MTKPLTNKNYTKITLLFLIAFGLKAYSQTKYYGKIETGYLISQFTTVTVDAGPDWKGYNLDDEQNGVEISMVNGFNFSNRHFLGLGIGYLNFEGINGFSIFTDFEYLPLKSKLSPLFNVKLGYNHIWNQYENGTGSEIIEFGAGANYKLSKKHSLYFQSGFSFSQQLLFTPVRLGFRF